MLVRSGTRGVCWSVSRSLRALCDRSSSSLIFSRARRQQNRSQQEAHGHDILQTVNPASDWSFFCSSLSLVGSPTTDHSEVKGQSLDGCSILQEAQHLQQESS